MDIWNVHLKLVLISISQGQEASASNTGKCIPKGRTMVRKSPELQTERMIYSILPPKRLDREIKIWGEGGGEERSIKIFKRCLLGRSPRKPLHRIGS